jgi:hypothetical protein
MRLDLFGCEASYVWEFGPFCEVTSTDETGCCTLVEVALTVI